jgi:hypothetical protein
MMKRATTIQIAALAAIGFLVTACQDTLIYGESTAFDLAIHVNDSPQSPVEVNAGLKRYAAETAPPVVTAKNENGKDTAAGEAVSSFSGFALTYDREGIFGDLFIRTQFASGFAANALAGDPVEAAKVVRADFVSDATFVSEANRTARGEIVKGINNFDAAKVSDLSCHPPVTNMRLLEIAEQSDPGCVKRVDPDFARQFLIELAFEDDRTPESFAKWRSALGMN